jgi:hypothetical protein
LGFKKEHWRFTFLIDDVTTSKQEKNPSLERLISRPKKKKNESIGRCFSKKIKRNLENIISLFLIERNRKGRPG